MVLVVRCFVRVFVLGGVAVGLWLRGWEGCWILGFGGGLGRGAAAGRGWLEWSGWVLGGGVWGGVDEGGEGERERSQIV